MSDPSRPSASVVVPTHRGAHRLPLLLEQLAAQHVDDPWELVVVIDGQLDGTPALVDAWRDRLDITVVTHERALGVAAALTVGFEKARGSYLIRCDDDLSLSSSFIADHLAAQEGRTDRVVLSLTRDLFEDSPYALAYGRPANERALAGYYRQVPDQRWQHLAACFSLHRETWATSGGFDPAFAYGEDSEFGYRLWNSGVEFVIDPALEVGHRGPALSAATRVPRAFVSGASRRVFAAAHPEAARTTSAATGWKSAVWNGLTSGLASAVRTPEGYRRLGGIVQRVLPAVPPPVGGKLVALAVEAAGLSGARHGSMDLHSYRGQKDAEISYELKRG